MDQIKTMTHKLVNDELAAAEPYGVVARCTCGWESIHFSPAAASAAFMEHQEQAAESAPDALAERAKVNIAGQSWGDTPPLTDDDKNLIWMAARFAYGELQPTIDRLTVQVRHLEADLDQAANENNYLSAQLASARQAMETVIHNFKQDEKDGYRSRDRRYAIDVLSQALSPTEDKPHA